MLRLNERMSMLRRADHGDVVVDREVLGVQDERRRVEEDLHAGLEQVVVVGPLRVVDEALVADLGDEQLHLEPALAGGGDRVDHRLVRDEVRAREDDLLGRAVDQRQEQPQVVLGLVPGTGRHHLADHGIRRRVAR